MSFWVELHCDILSNGPPDPSRIHPFCLSQRGDSPGEMAGGATSVPLAMKFVQSQAKANGWKRTAKGWACPHCLTTMQKARKP